MPVSKFLAVDFGAESGRAIVGILKNKTITLEEIHRFQNRQVRVLGHLRWDLLYLFEELKKSISLAVQKGHGDIESIGIDTWGVDFGLIAKNGEILGFPFSYRDSRTNGMMEKVFSKISREEIYSRTGIQFMQINSLYQFCCSAAANKELLGVCDKLLFMPDLFNFFLTGEAFSEYSIASTSQMLNAKRKRWDREIFAKLRLPLRIMAPIVQPGEIIGKLLPEISHEAGLGSVDVVAVGCHDTASAVAAVPAKGNDWAYLSSGTWSLIGIETEAPIINGASLKNNFTNEGGVFGTIRFLRNVMGLWLLQEARMSWMRSGEEYKYDELVQKASEVPEFKSIVDPDDSSFLNPPDMPEAIRTFCSKNGRPVPEGKGEFVRCIFESLALKYKALVKKLNLMRGKEIKQLHIVGGGSQNEMLNQFTADAIAVPVFAGPVEATAIGNILVQAIARGKVESLEKGRDLVARSFPLKMYEPKNPSKWDRIYNTYSKEQT